MGPVGDCYDYAMCESFLATLECELLDRSRFRSQHGHASVTEEARIAVFEYIEGWYNRHRRHSGLSCLSPVEFEMRHYSLPVTERRYLSTKVG
jgi:putative transposase